MSIPLGNPPNFGLEISVYTSKKPNSSTVQPLSLIGLGNVSISSDDKNIYISAQAFSGGTLTSPLILFGDPTQNLEIATKQYVDNAIAIALTGVMPGNSFDFLLEDGTGFIILEDRTGYIIQESRIVQTNNFDFLLEDGTGFIILESGLGYIIQESGVVQTNNFDFLLEDGIGLIDLESGLGNIIQE